jgi:peptide/nickel transport system substrate-binding protein
VSLTRFNRRDALRIAGLSSIAPMIPTLAAAEGGTLRAAMGASGPSEPIDPVAGLSSQTLAFVCFDRLTWVDPQGRVVPELATRWEHNPENTQWTFHLRTDVVFHDGKPFTSADVVRTYQRMLNSKLGSQAYRLFSIALDADGVTAVDPHTVRFNCKAPFWDLPQAAADSHLSIVQASAPLDALVPKPVGTGPFVLQEWAPGDHLFATKNPHYWRAGWPKLDAIRVFQVADVPQRVAGLLSNQFDLILDLNAVAVQQLKGNARVKISSVRSGNCININMQSDQKPFDDNRVRTALKLAYDRKKLVEAVFLGEAVEGTDQPISSAASIWGNVPVPPYDTARAKKLLADAGYPNGIDVTLTTSTIAAGAVDVAVAYQQYAAPAGIRVKVDQVPASGYYYNVDALKWNFWIEPWNMRPEDFLFFIEYAPRGTAIPPTRWNPPQFMQMLTAARAATNDKDRKAKFAALERFVASDGPSIMPVFVNVIDAHSTKVTGYQGNPIATNRTYWNIQLGSG